MTKRYHIVLLTVVLLLLNFVLTAQEWKNLGTDRLFELARKEAFDGNREKSRLMLEYILTESPNYSDVRILLGRTFAWDEQRDKAIEQFNLVLAKNPSYRDALSALIDAQTWDDQYETALASANTALQYHPNDRDFMYKQASLLSTLDRDEEALSVIGQLLQRYPTDKDAMAMRESIKVSNQRYTLTATVGADFYSRTFDPSYSGSVAIGRSNDWGSSILRLNYNRRFQSSALQGEIDLYPNLGKGFYAYLNYGYSASSLFPNHRFGAELYKSLPKSFEASIGLRHLIFSEAITIYTGSIGWYYKSMWFSLRPFITPDDQAPTSISAVLNVRRYFSNASTFIGLMGGMGYSPDIRTIQSTTGFDDFEIYTLTAQRIGITAQKMLRYNLIGSASYDLARQELSFDEDNFVYIHSILFSLAYIF